MPRHSGGRPPDSRKIRLLALTGVVACAVALPLAVAFAGSVGDEGRAAVRASLRDVVRPSAASGHARDHVPDHAPDHDDKAPSADPSRSPLLLGLGLATAARCGPELASPEGVEAQTCVLTQGDETWARTYYRNATGGALDSVLSVMGPAGRTVRMRCAVGAEDAPGMCETPREPTRGEPDAYTAVAEFAARAGSGPLLLRSGSNSGAPTGS